MLLIFQLFLYLISFFAIWAGTGLVVTSIEKVSRNLRISSFAVSFFILGFLSSTPEFAVGLSSLAEGEPEIFMGNLLGGAAVLFLFAVPLLAILGKGIKLQAELDRYTIAFCLFVIGAPALLVLDRRVGPGEGLLLMLSYLLLFIFVQRKKGFLDRNNHQLLNIKAYSLIDMAKVIVGIGLIFVSSNIIVDQTIVFANLFQMSPFYISLFGLSIGTNLPELSIAVRAVLSGRKDVAFGNYLGSASANSFLFGLFTVLNGAQIVIAGSFYITFVFIVGGLALFYYFTKSNNDLSRKEGSILFSIYILFILAEIFY